MAKDNSGNGKIKLRFFEVEVEGNNQTLLEGIKNLVTIANRGAVQAKPLKTLQAGEEKKGGEKESQEVLEVGGESEQIEVETPAEANNKPRRRSYATPKVIEVDFNSGTLPFATFCELKKPTEMIKKYLVSAAWLKEQRSIDVVTIDHVYTCFRKMNWGVPVDMGQAFRDGKRQGYFKKGAQEGQWELTHIGLDVVR